MQVLIYLLLAVLEGIARGVLGFGKRCWGHRPQNVTSMAGAIFKLKLFVLSLSSS
jgi:hypothetical protein